jgi:hypothetical protein
MLADFWDWGHTSSSMLRVADVVQSQIKDHEGDKASPPFCGSASTEIHHSVSRITQIKPFMVLDVHAYGLFYGEML